jgi:signal transduction histidine kinase
MGREFSGRRKDGREFPIEVGLNPFQVGSAAFVLAAIVDISERKRIQQLQDEFVSTVSHELRTPLTSIAASLGLLAGGKAGTLPDSAARLITIAHSNCQRLIGLVNDILDVKKIESGQMALHIQRCDARLLLAEAVEANRPLAESRSVHIEYEILLHEHFIDVDPDRFVQVATNLLSNAINFSPRDKAVVVSIAKSGRNVRIAVRDHGGGIPADFKHRVFERFTQADATTTKKKGGTGLGLSIARQIVELMKGRIGFEDAAGGGTIFIVEFPAAEDLAKATDICIDDKTSAPPVAADDCPLLPF